MRFTDVHHQICLVAYDRQKPKRRKRKLEESFLIFPALRNSLADSVQPWAFANRLGNNNSTTDLGKKSRTNKDAIEISGVFPARLSTAVSTCLCRESVFSISSSSASAFDGTGEEGMREGEGRFVFTEIAAPSFCDDRPLFFCCFSFVIVVVLLVLSRFSRYLRTFEHTRILR